MRLLTLATASLGLALSLGSAQAATISYGPDSTATLLTDFPNDVTGPITVSLPKFNAALGTLTSVSFTLMGSAFADYGIENRSNSPSPNPGNINSIPPTVTLNVTLTLYRPNLTQLVVSVPLSVQTFTMPRYDGTLDYAGPSGRSGNLMATQTESATTSAAGDLALFTGTGSIVLPVAAEGNSNVSGSGNINSYINTSAEAAVSVTYTYIAAPVSVPEPLGLSLLGAGLLGLGMTKLRRKA